MTDETLKEIIRQLKVSDRDFRLFGAKYMKVNENKLRVHMKRGTKVRNLDIEYNRGLDLYDVEDNFFSTSFKSKNPYKVTTKKHKGIYADSFKDLLEQTGGF